jgi:hypothetical protein
MTVNCKGQSKNLKHVLLLACIAISTCFVQAAEWRIEGVDPGGGGRYSSLRIDTTGNAHVAYYDDARNLLKYAFWDHSLKKWFTSTLDSSSGFCSLVLDSKQRPHISYLDFGHGKLKYAHWNGSAWEKETLQIIAKEIAFYTSISVDEKDSPRISYYEYWGAGDNYELHLRTASWNGKFWGVKTIDTTPGSGKFNSLVTDSTGKVHVAYANVRAENAGLRYAVLKGKNWDVTVLEGVTAPHPVFSVSLALDKNDVPHIVYTDLTDNTVKYATLKTGTWEIQPVDKLLEPAYPDRNGIAIDSEGNPYLSYFDAGSGILRIAHLRNKSWVTEVVDQNFAGFTSSLSIAQGRIWITYFDENGRWLKFAHRQLDSTEALAVDTVPSLGDSRKKVSESR